MTLRVLGNLDLRRQQIRGLTTGMANGIDFVELRPWSPIFAPVPSGTTPVRGDSSCLIVTFLRPLTGSFLAQQLAQGLIRDNLLAVDTALGRPLPLGLVVLATDGKSLVIELPRGDRERYNGRCAVVVRDASDAITVQDLEGRITAWNPGAERLYGWSEDEALQMNVRERIPPALQDEALAQVRQLSQAEVLEPYRTRRLTKAGGVLEVSMTATALLDEAGQVYAIATTERPSGASP